MTKKIMKALFVFAHPDDESISSGGTIATLTKNGVEVVLICATRGEAGQRGDPAVCTQEELPKVREKELRIAAKILGIKKLHILDFIDGTLHTVPVKKLEREIVAVMNKEKPDLIFTFNKEGGSKHPDHMQISKATTSSFEKYSKEVKKHVRLYHTATPTSLLKKLKKEGFSYTAFGEIRGTEFSAITTKVFIKPVEKTKIKAIQAHKTQHQDWDRFMKRFVHEEGGYEYFCLISEYNLT